MTQKSDKWTNNQVSSWPTNFPKLSQKSLWHFSVKFEDIQCKILQPLLHQFDWTQYPLHTIKLGKYCRNVRGLEWYSFHGRGSKTL